MTGSRYTTSNFSTHADQMLTEELIRTHIRHLQAGGSPDTTTRCAAAVLRRVDEELPCGLPCAYPDELAEWLGQSNWSPSTRKTYRSHIVRFFAWACNGDDPYISWDPSAELATPTVRPGVPRPAHDDDVLTACTRIPAPWRTHCIIAAYAGARAIEIARLHRHEVDEVDMLLHGKGNRDRVVPTHPEVWEAVRDLPPGPVTGKSTGMPATAHWVSKGTNQHLRRVGLTATIHQFRHWFACRALDEIGDILVVKELLGHVSVATTQVYTQVSDRRRRAAVAGLPRLTA